MAKKLTKGSIIPEFQYDTPYLPQQSFYQLLRGDKPVILVFLRNFGHPLSRHYIMEYIKSADELLDARLVCVVQTRPQIIADSIPQNAMPYELICDAEGVLYQFFGVETEKNWLKSYSFKGLKILKEAKKQGFQEHRSDPQQLPLTAVVGQEGHVLFAHYGQSITDLPEDCGAMQRVMEGLLAMLEMEGSREEEQPEEQPEETGWQWETELAVEQNPQAEAEPELEQTVPSNEKSELEAEKADMENPAAAEPVQQEGEAYQVPGFEAEPAEEENEWGQALIFEEPEQEAAPQVLQQPEEPAAPESPAEYGGAKPKAEQRAKPKIDLAALGFINSEDD